MAANPGLERLCFSRGKEVLLFLYLVSHPHFLSSLNSKLPPVRSSRTETSRVLYTEGRWLAYEHAETGPAFPFAPPDGTVNVLLVLKPPDVGRCGH